MKINLKQSEIILFSIISSILFVSYSIYDYYENDIFNGWGLFLFLFLFWLISLITSIMYLVKKKGGKKNWISILINIVCITIVLSYSSMVEETTFQNFELPRNIDSAEIDNCKYVHYYQDSSQFIILKYKEPLAFGGGHYILGLYSNKNKLIDECLFGEFPLKFISWEKDKLEFRAFYYRGNYEYVKMWVEKNQSISDYRLIINIEEKE